MEEKTFVLVSALLCACMVFLSIALNPLNFRAVFSYGPMYVMGDIFGLFLLSMLAVWIVDKIVTRRRKGATS